MLKRSSCTSRVKSMKSVSCTTTIYGLIHRMITNRGISSLVNNITPRRIETGYLRGVSMHYPRSQEWTWSRRDPWLALDGTDRLFTKTSPFGYPRLPEPQAEASLRRSNSPSRTLAVWKISKRKEKSTQTALNPELWKTDRHRTGAPNEELLAVTAPRPLPWSCDSGAPTLAASLKSSKRQAENRWKANHQGASAARYPHESIHATGRPCPKRRMLHATLQPPQGWLP